MFVVGFVFELGSDVQKDIFKVCGCVCVAFEYRWNQRESSSVCFLSVCFRRGIPGCGCPCLRKVVTSCEVGQA